MKVYAIETDDDPLPSILHNSPPLSIISDSIEQYKGKYKQVSFFD